MSKEYRLVSKGNLIMLSYQFKSMSDGELENKILEQQSICIVSHDIVSVVHILFLC